MSGWKSESLNFWAVLSSRSNTFFDCIVFNRSSRRQKRNTVVISELCILVDGVILIRPDVKNFCPVVQTIGERGTAYLYYLP